MSYQHKRLAAGKWYKLSLAEQMANIGAEVGRAINWKKKKKPEYSQLAFYRALELLSLTKSDPKYTHKASLKEICRLYECLVDYFDGDNIYGSSDKLWEKYFYGFNWAARINK